MRRPLRMLLPALSLAASLANAAPATPAQIYVNGVAPFAYAEQGVYRGVLYDMLAALRQRTGSAHTIRPVPLRRAQLMLATQPEAIATLARFAEVEQAYRWLCKLADDQLVLVTRAGSTHEIGSLAAARQLRVGVLLGGPAESAARRAGLAHIETVSSAASNARKLANGRIDAWLTARSIALFEQRGIGGSEQDLRIGPGLQTISQYLAAPLAMPEAHAASWRAACATLQEDGTLERILASYQQRRADDCQQLSRSCLRPDRQAAP